MSHIPKSLDLDAAETQTSCDLDTPTLNKNLKDLGPLIDYITSESEEEILEDFFQLKESNPELSQFSGKGKTPIPKSVPSTTAPTAAAPTTAAPITATTSVPTSTSGLVTRQELSQELRHLRNNMEAQYNMMYNNLCTEMAQRYNAMYDDVYCRVYSELNGRILRLEKSSDNTSDNQSSSTVSTQTHKQKQRCYPTEIQTMSLKAAFYSNGQPSPDEMRKMSVDIDMDYQRIKTWFHNQRQIKKKKDKNL